MEFCQYCNKNIINGTLCKIFIETIDKEKKENKCCNVCLLFLKIAQVLMYLPYKYMIFNGKVFEIDNKLDINGKMWYITFNDGKVIKEYSNRIKEIGTIPNKLTNIITDNCVIKPYLKMNTIKLPNYIIVKESNEK